MACIVRILSLLVILFLSFMSTYNSILESSASGFSVDLIHRDSPYSPLYDPSTTSVESFNKAIQRGISRLNHYYAKISENGQMTPVAPDNGQYLMKISIGTPPFDAYGILDTGSDLTWIQCQPCDSCYKQTNPIYDPKSSSTYSDINCQSQECHLLDTTTCSPQSLCSYSYGYASASITQGVLAKDTITFSSSDGGQPVSFPNIVFGCGHNNSGQFKENEMGIIALGGRPLSTTSQIGASSGSNKFSYCLVTFHTDPSITSKLYLGPGSEVAGQGVVTIPLIPKEDKTYYFVTLVGISVGDKFLPFNANNSTTQGNMFIDTGTPPTIVPQDFYNRLEAEVKSSIQMTPYVDPQLGTQLCYQSSSVITLQAPILTIHFDNGGQFPLGPTSTFIPPKDNVFCFAVVPNQAEVGIIGNFAQTNYRIGFDLDAHTVSFRQTDCTKE